jgi:hypothetical protein
MASEIGLEKPAAVANGASRALVIMIEEVDDPCALFKPAATRNASKRNPAPVAELRVR